MKIEYRRRLDNGDWACVTINVPDENWERAFDYCNQYFCGHLPPPPTMQPQGKPISEVRRGKSR